MSISEFDRAYSAYREWIGWSNMPVVRKRGRGRPTRRREIVVAGDFHAPWHSEAALKALIREHSRSADALIVAGDLADMWASSRWPKSRKLSDPVNDFRSAQKILNILAEAFQEVIVIGGNHDARPRKWFTEHLPVELIEYLELTGPGALNPLGLMISGLDNVSMAASSKAGHAEFGFLHQIGDCVISHAEAYSKIPNRAVSGTVLQWLKSFAEPQGIVKPFRVICQAHTHQLGTVVGDFGTLCIENGAMCGTQEYQSDPKLRSVRPPVLGWSVIFQDRGVTDLRESRAVPFLQ